MARGRIVELTSETPRGVVSYLSKLENNLASVRTPSKHSSREPAKSHRGMAMQESMHETKKVRKNRQIVAAVIFTCPPLLAAKGKEEC